MQSVSCVSRISSKDRFAWAKVLPRVPGKRARAEFAALAILRPVQLASLAAATDKLRCSIVTDLT